MAGTILLIARVLIALMFVASGYDALMSIGIASTYFDSLGFPLPTIFAIAVGLFELAAGLVLIVGYQTPIVCVVLALYALVATWIGHYSLAFGLDAAALANKQAMFKDIAIAGGLLAVALQGGGPLSVDGWMTRRRGRAQPV